MMAIVRRVLSLFDPAAGGADRLNSLRAPNQSFLPGIPFLQIVLACLANPLKFHIPCASPRDVAAPASPFIEQMALSCFTQWLAAMGIRYRDLEFSAFRRGLI